MLQNRTWIDAGAEAEFWRHMARLEDLHARLSAMGRWTALLQGGPFRRAALQRDLDALRTLAQDLVDRHTRLAETLPEAELREGQRPSADAMMADAPLRTLAGMVVSLRQDRAVKLDAGEEKTV